MQINVILLYKVFQHFIAPAVHHPHSVLHEVFLGYSSKRVLTTKPVPQTNKNNVQFIHVDSYLIKVKIIQNYRTTYIYICCKTKIRMCLI